MEKYTVIIPTRDRAETLAATIRTCLRQNYANFEIIVSDNCSEDNTREIVEGFHDVRIRYIKPEKRLSMSGNFEFALKHVDDGFVMFIGSDDGIMPDAIEYVDSIVKKYKVDAVSCVQATYVWPDFPDQDVAGNLSFGTTRDGVEIRKSSEWLSRTLNFEFLYCFELPNLYCGFVHKRIIDKAFKDGTYFRSITPDAYSAFATAIFIDEYAFSFRPFSIAGASVKSNGASALNAKGNTSESRKFLSENDIEFSSGFVNCPSYEVILGESFSQLSLAFPEHCARYHIDYSNMLKKSLMHTNEKTVNEVKAAVDLMAINFKDKLTDFPKKTKELKFSVIANLFRKVKCVLNLSKIIAIPHSKQLTINNVDDAALVAHVLINLSQGYKFKTVGTLIKIRLFNILR